MNTGNIGTFAPTTQAYEEQFLCYRVHFNAIDIGGHEQARRVWETYCKASDGIVFIVDSVDKKRIEEAREELTRILENEELSAIPVLILGNKIDVRGAMSKEELTEQLGYLNVERNGPVMLIMCSVMAETGYIDGFRWLANVTI